METCHGRVGAGYYMKTSHSQLEHVRHGQELKPGVSDLKPSALVFTSDICHCLHPLAIPPSHFFLQITENASHVVLNRVELVLWHMALASSFVGRNFLICKLEDGLGICCTQSSIYCTLPWMCELQYNKLNLLPMRIWPAYHLSRLLHWPLI